jgi:hypothetical protein
MQKIQFFGKAKIKVPYLTGALSFFIYIIVSNVLNNLLLLSFGLKSRILIVASFCRTGLPDGTKNHGLEIGVILIFVKFIILGITIFYNRKIKSSNAGRIFVLLLICFNFIELFGLVSFFIDKINGTTYFKYFASSIYIYVFEKQPTYFYSILFLNIGIAFMISIYLSRTLKPFFKRPFFLAFFLSILSVGLLVVTHILFKIFI